LNRPGAFGASNASNRSKKQSREDAMSVVNPLTKDKAPTEAHGLFDALSKQFGKMPNMFGLMAHRPDVLRKFLPFYSAVMEGGTVEHRYKELAYLKTSLINACEY
jgi:alkylhydroperoxidase family enzyme